MQYNQRDVVDYLRSANSLLAMRKEITSALGRNELKKSLKNLVQPSDPSKGMRRIGMALLLSPDPLTDIPAAILIITSLLIRSRGPAALSSIVSESRRILSNLSLISL